MVNLGIKIGRLKLKNPVMAASGTFGTEYAGLVDLNKLGAIVTKTITLEPRAGNPPPRLAETSSGMLNSIGLENKGVDDFIKNKIPLLNKFKTTIMASIAGDNKDDYSKLARRLDKVSRVDGIEINLSCPNIKHGKRADLIAQDAEAVYAVVKSVRKSTKKTIIAKLSPNVTDITKIAKAAEDAGADALLVANTFFGMTVDIRTKTPKLGNISGGLSGPAIKPLVLYMVRKTYEKIKIPIVGCGGIMDWTDAVEFLLCGSTAIQVGTASFVNPAAGIEIIAGIKKYLGDNKINDIKELTGAMKG